MVSDAHQKLTEAHHEAARLARSLDGLLASVSLPAPAEARVKAIQLGFALDSVGKAEHVCGHCSEEDHSIQSYEEVLDHHRQAYLKFERLSSNMEESPMSYSPETAVLAGEIGNHLDAAEKAHQLSLHKPGIRIKA